MYLFIDKQFVGDEAQMFVLQFRIVAIGFDNRCDYLRFVRVRSPEIKSKQISVVTTKSQ